MLKINKDTNQTYLEDLKDELSELRFEQEVMARFGEEEMGVYRKQFLESAIEYGKKAKVKYYSEMSASERQYFVRRRRGPRVLAVDWDKVA